MNKKQPSAVKKVEQILELVEDERLLQAFSLHATLTESLNNNNGAFPDLPVFPLHSPTPTNDRKSFEESAPSPPASSSDDFLVTMRNLLCADLRWSGKMKNVNEGLAVLNTSSNVAKYEALDTTARRLHSAKSSLTSKLDWTIGQVAFGITTSYRREANGTLTLKMEGDLDDVPLFEQLCVLREIDFYSLWAPFMTASKTILQVEKIELVGWFKIAVPLFGLMRDCAFHAFGCDCLREDGVIMIVAER